MILHVDMDAFYASVEERDDPTLRGKPVIVGGTPEGRGVVAAANYVARRYGVRSAMPAATALKRCPQAVVLRPRMEHYAGISRQIHEVFLRFTPLVEPLSLDEAFLDATASERIFGAAPEIGRQIKQQILDELQLVASVGVAPNKFLAKLASDLEKPDGFVVVAENKVAEFLEPLPVSRIWGVGRVTQQRFDRWGVHTIGQLRRLPLEQLQAKFGKSGQHFWNLARGIDDRRVVPDREAKSISNETTFPEDIDDIETLSAWLMELTEQVARRLRRHQLRGRTVQIKVRYSDFHTITRSQTLPEPTNSTSHLWQAASQLLASKLPPRRLLVRLLGVGVSNLSSVAQLGLFEEGENSPLDQVTDQIREKFGSRAVRRGRGMR